MKDGRKKHLGETKKIRFSLTARLVKWKSREWVQVEILETGERIWVSYADFNKRRIVPDLINFPPHTDCSFNQAKFYVISIAALIIASLAAIIYQIAS